MRTFFVDRPIFATVIAILISLAGVLGLNRMSMEQLPDIAPPTINISARYSGASAETVENTVTQIIEQQLTGLDGLQYFSSTSSSNGAARIRVVFNQGTDPDIAQMQVTNRVRQIENRLPDDVVNTGVNVTKREFDSFLNLSIVDESDTHTNQDVGDFVIANLVDPLSRVEGVGYVDAWCSQHAMRIWLDPYLMRSYALMPSDVISAIRAENIQLSAGYLGALPQMTDQGLTLTVTAARMLSTPEEFRGIILKHEEDGSYVTLGDVATVELGSESYTTQSTLNYHPSAGIDLYLSSGANTLETTKRVYAALDELKRRFPPHYNVLCPMESSAFIERSIGEVTKALLEAIILVVVVMYIFLGDLRTTIIPTLTVPVVILGTAAVLSMLGFTINTLTMFALVIAIGLLVDDTIVVVENVERLMREQGLAAREATIISLHEVFSSLIGIAVVLSVVFLPMSFFGGAAGIIYRQFSVTIITAMLLSVLMALTLVPALCARLLRPKPVHHTSLLIRLFASVLRLYRRLLLFLFAQRVLPALVYLGIVAASFHMYGLIKTGFIPDEDQGRIFINYTLPETATIDRTAAVEQIIHDYLLREEGDRIRLISSILGQNRNGQAQNYGIFMIALADWEDRPGMENSAQAIMERAYDALPGLISDATVDIFTASPVRGLGDSSGFEMQVLAPVDTYRDDFLKLQQEFLASAARNPNLRNVRGGRTVSAPQLHVSFDSVKASALGVSMADAYATLSTAWAAKYVNDFLDRGRVKKVYVQSTPQYRARPDDLRHWCVRSRNGEMVPLSEFTQSAISRRAESLERYNGFAAFRVNGRPRQGLSSGEAMAEIAAIAGEYDLPYSWSGVSFQEAATTGHATLLYLLSVGVIFLCLAALYESYIVPLCILAVIPFGLLGAEGMTLWRGLDGNVYFQVALLTAIGLSAKNAIMMVTFMREQRRAGQELVRAALSAATMRLRPILMTSLAFVFGVLPLAFATGVGANSRIAIGTGIVGGTVLSTLLSIFFVPLSFIALSRLHALIFRRQHHKRV